MSSLASPSSVSGRGRQAARWPGRPGPRRRRPGSPGRSPGRCSGASPERELTRITSSGVSWKTRLKPSGSTKRTSSRAPCAAIETASATCSVEKRSAIAAGQAAADASIGGSPGPARPRRRRSRSSAVRRRAVVVLGRRRRRRRRAAVRRRGGRRRWRAGRASAGRRRRAARAPARRAAAVRRRRRETPAAACRRGPARPSSPSPRARGCRSAPGSAAPSSARSRPGSRCTRRRRRRSRRRWRAGCTSFGAKRRRQRRGLAVPGAGDQLPLVHEVDVAAQRRGRPGVLGDAHAGMRPGPSAHAHLDAGRQALPGCDRSPARRRPASQPPQVLLARIIDSATIRSSGEPRRRGTISTRSSPTIAAPSAGVDAEGVVGPVEGLGLAAHHLAPGLQVPRQAVQEGQLGARTARWPAGRRRASPR